MGGSCSENANVIVAIIPRGVDQVPDIVGASWNEKRSGPMPEQVHPRFSIWRHLRSQPLLRTWLEMKGALSNTQRR